jgi:predicted nucleic acid-binding protein
MYLLDTFIVFELREAKSGRAEPGLSAWAAGVARSDLFVSAITLLELESAAAALERRDKAAGKAVRGWIADRVMPAFDDRILPVDAAIVRRRALIPYTDPRDGLLAATALEHGLTLVTRNIAAFKAGRVKLFNPAGYKPDAAEDESDWRQAARAAPLWLKNLFVRT